MLNRESSYKHYTRMNNPSIIGITPFELPDVNLAISLSAANAFPVLHLGRDKILAAAALKEITQKQLKEFGVCIASARLGEITLPDQVSTVILPYGMKVSVRKEVKLFYQVFTLEEALKAEAEGAEGIILKGNEAAGKVGYESAYVLLQRVIKVIKNTDIYVQGGMGIHTSAAVIAAGAKGVILDSQLILFPECSAPRSLKQICETLSGNETKLIGNYRVLLRPNSPPLAALAGDNDLENYLGDLNIEKSYLPLGQDVAFSGDLLRKFKKLDRLVFALQEAVQGHLKQAKALNVISAGNALAKDLNITYPIAQGPMTRVSDVAPFAAAVSEAGALPFIALSLLKGNQAKELLTETRNLLAGKTWGVGILGFAEAALREEQLNYIKELRPPVVLIAGGRPSQMKPLEQLGIKTFLHVPSASLLDMFLKEGAKRFVFEGRECGGHVGPLSSMVLWEKQIERLLQEDNPEQISVFFAGGIHDALSASMIAVMAAPLAARGVKIGVLMGTSYLYTKEAVSTGAIGPGFQQQAQLSGDTVLLETAPGHETRCLNSDFAGFFHQEKQKLEQQGIDKKEIWAKLEQLNVGRLRIAAKGIERRGTELVTIDEKEQLKLGMYMIGQVAAMCNEVISIHDLHRNVAEGNYQFIKAASSGNLPQAKKKSLNVAIVGMACIYPDAKNIEEYWRNIVLGKDAVTEVPDERWNKDLYYDPSSAAADMSHSKWGGFIPPIDFNPLEFGIPPQSIAAIDPTQLLTLMVARQAMEHAGYSDGSFNAENVSVIIGAEGGHELANNYNFRCLSKQIFGDMPAELDEALPGMTEDSFPGILANVISGRISNRLNLGGRNFTVDAACASSLAAIDLACQELFLEKSDMVLAGGADLHNGINDYLLFSSTKALSRKGRCASFDKAADGIALGEGIAMVVLKRHEDALRDGDTVYAVIQGVGGSSDGKSLGLTAPRKSGQTKALTRAYAQAGISPAAVGLIEAHGTGTVVGDKIELSALTDLLTESGALPHQTHLGSVKTQIGHTKCAAGLAGLIKTALSAYYGVKPPTINLTSPNGYYNAALSPFAFHTEASLWMEDKRYSGVSAFGFGGTNFHAVLESAAEAPEHLPVLQSWPSELFVFRGDSFEEAKDRLQVIKTMLDDNDSIDMKDIAFSLASANAKPVQLSIIANKAEDLVMKIDLVLSGVESKDTFFTKPLKGKVAFLFPGQGSQRVNMARDLFVIFPVMRKLLKNNPQYQHILFPDAVFDEAAARLQEDKIRDTRMAQPLLGIVDLAIASFLRELGIAPDMVAGHSYGELPALCFAGAFDENQLVYLSEQRAHTILNAVDGDDKGAMVAVNASEHDLSALLKDNKEVTIVNYNSPLQLVLAGTTPGIEQLCILMKAAKISYKQLPVACAFHSPMIARSQGLFKEVLKDCKFKDLAIPVWSNTTAETYPVQAEAIKERMGEQLVSPVKFAAQLQAMYAAGARIFIEVGPGKVLSALTKACLGHDEVILHTEDKRHNKLTHLLSTLAAYMETGATLRLEKLFEGRNARLLNLNEPAQYKKNPAVWLINGQHALPSTGKLPDYAASPIIKPIKMKKDMVTESTGQPVSGMEEMLREYLQSMNSLVKAQRDVMLQFLGQQVQVNPPVVQHQEIVRQPAAIQTAVLPKPEVLKPVITDVKAVLLEIVSAKTGYPADMLGLDMDLEADLSIDSIKRMEIIGSLRTRLGGFNYADSNEDTFMEQLAGIKTLNGLLNWIGDHSRDKVNTPGLVTAAPQLNNNNLLTIEAIKATILKAVSLKTGYPEDMLGMELDLEADLSIDSIKRMEIIADLKTKLGFNAEQYTHDRMEQLTAVKTLNALSQLIAELQGNTSVVPLETEKQPETAVPLKEEPLTRFRFELQNSLFNTAAGKLKHQLLTGIKGLRFAVTDDGGLQSAAIKELFEQEGASVDIINADDNIAGYHGLIILNRFAALDKKTIMDHAALIKRLDFEQVKWVYLVSDTKVYLNAAADTSSLRHFQGYSGFFKSLDKEYENTKCRIVGFTGQLPAEAVAAITLKEILHPDSPSEVVYTEKGRQTLELIPTELATGDHLSSVELGKDAVVLVLGGAQGITSSLITHFAETHPCRYILVGRSPDPRSDRPDHLSSLKTKDDIRQFLIAQGDLKLPLAIENETSRIFKNNQVLDTIAVLEKSGSTVVYESLDLRDEEGLSKLIRTIYEKYDRLDGVVHGAGLLEDKLLHSKSIESFKRVFDTKVTPLRVLAEQLRADTQFVVLFSSIASVYGNRGQTDYAAANSVMDNYAWALKEKISGKVMSINWGPWKGAGMVSAALEEEYQRRGIALIPLQEGMETFVSELKYGTESQVLIMAGNTW